MWQAKSKNDAIPLSHCLNEPKSHTLQPLRVPTMPYFFHNVFQLSNWCVHLSVRTSTRNCENELIVHAHAPTISQEAELTPKTKKKLKKSTENRLTGFNQSIKASNRVRSHANFANNEFHR